MRSRSAGRWRRCSCSCSSSGGRRRIELTALTQPKDALEIHVVAKQWMWRIQHPSGAREIDELHVPADTNVRLA